MQVFEEIFFFKLRTTKEQKTILCQLEWGRLAEGIGHETG